MKLEELYPSRWLKASDLNGKPALHTIEGMAMEEFDDGETKPVLRLKGSKGLVLNRTNAATIASFLGDDTDHWPGRQIVLFPAKVNFQGRLTDAIRVREPRQPAAAPVAAPAVRPVPAPAPAAPVAAPGNEDDVPF